MWYGLQCYGLGIRLWVNIQFIKLSIHSMEQLPVSANTQFVSICDLVEIAIN